MLFLTLGIIFLTLVVGILPSIVDLKSDGLKKIIKDGKSYSWKQGALMPNNKKRLSRWGIGFYFLVIVLVGLSALQYKLNDKIASDKEVQAQNAINKANATISQKQDALKSSQDLMTSRVAKGIDSGIDVNSRGLAAAFAKQGIDFDSVMRKHKDTTARTTIINTSEPPRPEVDFGTANSYGIELISRKNRSYEFKLIFSSQETALKLQVDLYSVIETNRGSLFRDVNRGFFDSANTRIIKGGAGIFGTCTMTLTHPTDTVMKNLFVVAKGSYWDKDLKHRYKLYSRLVYFVSTKKGPYFIDKKEVKRLAGFLESE